MSTECTRVKSASLKRDKRIKGRNKK